ncbi:15439_t:CDS:2 [Acaulospora morrowiae]|uniref:15439_t:CDS:1 n=1 Tax=Acaulospora morrowiae TaxID=94023 RepID=A0A9N8VDF4_9GLOM|nr:15439_t:CDS:2 [Acaulospora morrowiae]
MKHTVPTSTITSTLMVTVTPYTSTFKQTITVPYSTAATSAVPEPAFTTSNDPVTSNNQSSSLSVGVIVVIVLVCLLVVAIAIGLVVYWKS